MEDFNISSKLDRIKSDTDIVGKKCRMEITLSQYTKNCLKLSKEMHALLNMHLTGA